MASNNMRIPPHNVDAEENVLGSILLSKNICLYATSKLKTEHFYVEKNRRIYDAVLKINNRSENVDPITLINQIKEDGFSQEVEATYIASLTGRVRSSMKAVDSHIKIIKDKYKAREIICLSQDAIELCYLGEDVSMVSSKISTEMVSFSQDDVIDIGNIGDIAKNVMSNIDDVYLNGKDPINIRTGFADIDNRIYGLQKADLVIVAGRPGMGKTTFAMNIVLNISKEKKVLVFSMEMRKEKLVKNLISALSGVSKHEITMGYLNEEKHKRVKKASESLSQHNVIIDGSSALKIENIQARAKLEALKDGLDLVVVDYLGLAKGSNTQNKVVEISEISGGLKALAKDLDIPVIALSQLNRSVEGRTDKRPMSSDLRDSGAVEQDADVIAMLYRDGYYNKDQSNPLKDVTEVIFTKVRDGEPGTDELIFDGLTAQFKSKAKEEYYF